jgi:hypothetical protein
MGHYILLYWVTTSILAARVFHLVAMQTPPLRPCWLVSIGAGLVSIVAGLAAGWFVIPILLLDKIARFLIK